MCDFLRQERAGKGCLKGTKFLKCPFEMARVPKKLINFRLARSVLLPRKCPQESAGTFSFPENARRPLWNTFHTKDLSFRAERHHLRWLEH